MTESLTFVNTEHGETGGGSRDGRLPAEPVTEHPMNGYRAKERQ